MINNKNSNRVGTKIENNDIFINGNQIQDEINNFLENDKYNVISFIIPQISASIAIFNDGYDYEEDDDLKGELIEYYDDWEGLSDKYQYYSFEEQIRNYLKKKYNVELEDLTNIEVRYINEDK